jgi:nucleoside phosphorylase/tetratricopeptide (TPR) repeat protein
MIEKVDIGIVIALKEEFKQLFAGITSKAHFDKTTNTYSYIFQYTIANVVHNCVTTFISTGDMGPTKAALATERLLQNFKPEKIVNIGIAGSLDSEICLGDVVVAKQTDNYLHNTKAVDSKTDGKAISNKTSPKTKKTGMAPNGFELVPSGDPYKTTEKYLSHANNLDFAYEVEHKNWLSTCTEVFNKLSQSVTPNIINSLKEKNLLKNNPNIHTGNIASSTVVGASPNFSTWLKTNHDRKYIAIEMESSGVADVTHTHGKEILIIRGISDFSDDRKKQLDNIGGIFRKYAMTNAISLMWLLLHIDKSTQMIESQSECEYFVLFQATTNKYNKPKLEAMFEMMKDHTQDSNLRFVEVRRSSLIFVLQGSIEGYNKLKRLLFEHQDLDILGHKILYISLENIPGERLQIDDLNKSFFSSEQIEKSEQEVTKLQEQINPSGKKSFKTDPSLEPIFKSKTDGSHFPLLSQIPSSPKDFVGRNLEISEITSKIHQDGTSIIIIRGMGGVGKSTLAYALVEQLKEVYNEGQLHVKLMVGNTKPLLPSEAMSQVIRSFERDKGEQIVLPDNEDELGNIYRSLLNGKKILLLLDNAMSNNQIEPLIPPNSCLLLITSRNYLSLPGAYRKIIKTLPRQDSINLLISIEKRIDNKADLLAELCGDLPIALRIAADLLAKRQDLSIDEYMGRLAKAKERLKLIDATISLSYDFLSPHEQELWRSLSVFQNSFISVSVAAIWDMRDDFEKAEDILWEFVSYSLLEFDETTKRYNFHDLVRLFADSKLIDTERFEYQKRYSSHFRSLSVNIKELYLEGNESILTALDIFDRYWKDIEAALTWGDTYYRDDPSIADLYSTLIGNLVQVFSLRLPLSKRIELHNSAINAAIVANNKESEAAHRGNLAQAYVLLGDFQKAKNCIEESLAIFKEIGGTKGEEGKAVNYGVLGTIHYELNNMNDSISYHTIALEIYRKINNRRGEGSELCSLAMIYSSGKILNKFSDPITQYKQFYENVRKAENFYNQYLSICKELGDLRGEAIAHLDIGIFYEQVSFLDLVNVSREKARSTKRKAIESYKKSYDIAIQIDDKETMVKCLFNTGSLFMESNEKDTAIKFLLPALQLYKEIGDEDHIAKTTTLLLNCGYKFD